MTPRDLIDDLRSRINPAYAAQVGTESWERRLCVEALEAQAGDIERLRRYIDALHGKVDVRHLYNGLCPDETQPDSRDDECPACLLLTPTPDMRQEK